MNHSFGQQAAEEATKPPASALDQNLVQLAEGAAANMLAVNSEDVEAFRKTVTEWAKQLRDDLAGPAKLALIQNVLQEFERYRKLSEASIDERVGAWRGLVAKLFVELLSCNGIKPASPNAAGLVQRIPNLSTVSELSEFQLKVDEFLLRESISRHEAARAQSNSEDISSANDNAAGLRGAGAALEHVRRIMDSGAKGYAVLFQLNCLDMIGERFGIEVVYDSLMAVSAFLTQRLRSDDAVYHWSDSALIAVLQTPANLQIMKAAMRRIVDNNRDISVEIGGRPVMLRIPLDFAIAPLETLKSPEDLQNLSAPTSKKW